MLIGDDGEILAGHGRILAMKELGLAAVPTIKLSHLSPEERPIHKVPKPADQDRC